MIVVTGGAGFIGSNIVAALNARDRKDILVVDHMKNGHKMHNLADLDITDYLDQEDFMSQIKTGLGFNDVEAVFHLGACSRTIEWDGQYIMRNNFEYSKNLLHWCNKVGAQFIYASSASVYGFAENGFQETRKCEKPINMYAFSKFQFDQYVRNLPIQLKQRVVGLRYFNVYGPREAHKGSMSSVPFRFNKQILDNSACKLFTGTDGYLDGEQQRDFIFVEDAVAVNLWFFDHPEQSGIFNLGTGSAVSFNDVARAVIAWHMEHRKVNPTIEYIQLPDHLKGSYQSYTQADISALRSAGYKDRFHNIQEGVSKYLNWLNA